MYSQRDAGISVNRLKWHLFFLLLQKILSLCCCLPSPTRPPCRKPLTPNHLFVKLSTSIPYLDCTALINSNLRALFGSFLIGWSSENQPRLYTAPPAVPSPWGGCIWGSGSSGRGTATIPSYFTHPLLFCQGEKRASTRRRMPHLQEFMPQNRHYFLKNRQKYGKLLGREKERKRN